MGLFDLFRGLVQEKAEEPELPAPRQEEDELEIYSGMRVEVTTFDGQLLFVAKLIGPREGRAQLHQYSESFSHQGEEEPVRVRIRGYHDHARKAVYMEGTISVLPERKWQVEELVVARIGNDRAFFRLDTNVDATATIMGGRNAGEKACKLLNISVGGACIASAYPFQEGDKFLLKVKLLEDRDTSVMYCQVLRIINRGENKPTEFGCRFLELNESDEAKITQNIFAAQRQQRKIGRASCRERAAPASRGRRPRRPAVNRHKKQGRPQAAPAFSGLRQCAAGRHFPIKPVFWKNGSYFSCKRVSIGVTIA